jgi:hypothetical protein
MGEARGLSGPGGRDRRGLKDGNDRIARIARFLSTPVKNPNVAELVLTLLDGEDSEVLARWPKDDASTEMAYQIDAMLLDAANDAATTIDARLAWVTTDGVTWLSKNFRARCTQTEQENVRPLDGTMQSMLQQNQRHTEALAAQLAQITNRSEERFERSMSIFTGLQEMLLRQVESSERRRLEAEEREQETLELAEQAAGQAEEAAAEVAAAGAGKDDPMGKVIEIAARQLMSGGAAAK